MTIPTQAVARQRVTDNPLVNAKVGLSQSLHHIGEAYQAQRGTLLQQSTLSMDEAA